MTSEWTAAGRIELDVQEGYRLWADSYDLESNALVLVEEPVVDRLLDGIAFADVLDAGAGTGRHALRLAARGARVTAIDASREMLALARAKAAQAGATVAFREARLDQRLPFEEESFDLVVCALVLCHFADFKPVVAEFARVLRPGGHLLVTDFHPDIVAAGARTSFSREGERYVLPNPPLTTADYVDAATGAGLSVREVVEIPLNAAPAWSMNEAFARTFKDNQLCLILLAHRA